MTVYPPGASHGPRVLSDHELVWVLQGGGRVIFDRQELLLRAGELILLGPAREHRFEWSDAGPSVHGYVHFALASGAHDVAPTQLPITRSFALDDPTAAMFRYLSWLAVHRGEGWSDRVRDVLDCLLGMLLIGPLPDPPTTRSLVDVVMDHASAVWSAGPMRRLSLAEMAAAATVSVGHLSRAFQLQLGSSPSATLERIRLAGAERLLARSSMSLALIAEVTGYADAYHLSRRFRRQFGIPPATYRRLSADGDVPLPAAIVRVLPLIDRLQDRWPPTTQVPAPGHLRRSR